MNTLEGGHDLDARIAEKVMGWKRMRWCDWQHDSRESLTYAWHDADGNIVAHAQEMECEECGKDAKFWCPSTDIAAAWTVMTNVNDKYTCMCTFTIDKNGQTCCVFTPIRNFYQESSYKIMDNPHVVRANTVELAICRAALQFCVQPEPVP